jgi:hypothetical protein
MELQVEKWRAQAAAISDSAGILAGGDGPARKKKGVINPINVYGIGETTVEFWANRKAEDAQIMCSGGNVDWAMESARSNTRANPHSGCHDTAVHSRTRCFVCSR